MNPMLMQAGFTILGNLFGSSGRGAANAQAQAQATIAAAQADANNIIREGNNQLSAAQAAAGNQTRSINNQISQTNYAKQRSGLMTQMMRVMDAQVAGGLEQRLQSAEQLGAIAASVGATGVGGSSAALLDRTMSLRANRIQEVSQRQGGQRTYDQLLQIAGLDTSRWSAVDIGQSFANSDFGRSFGPAFTAQVDDSFLGRALSGGNLSGLAKLLSDGFAKTGGSDWYENVREWVEPQASPWVSAANLEFIP